MLVAQGHVAVSRVQCVVLAHRHVAVSHSGVQCIFVCTKSLAADKSSKVADSLTAGHIARIEYRLEHQEVATVMLLGYNGDASPSPGVEMSVQSKAQTVESDILKNLYQEGKARSGAAMLSSVIAADGGSSDLLLLKQAMRGCCCRFS